MSNQDVRRQALESLLRPLEPSDGRAEIVVTYRRFEDYERYEVEIEELKRKLKRAEQDIYTWSTVGNQYTAALDEIRRLEKILRKHGISY